MQDGLFIRVLTGDDLLVEAPALIQWKGRTARTLFALLALHPGEPVSRDRLAGLLWAENDQQAARSNLRMALLSLRRVLDPVGPDLIRATNESIMLDVKREMVDWALFESLCARPDLQSRLRALELYGGELLANLPAPASPETFTEVLRIERERLRDLAIKTGVDLIAEFEGVIDRDTITFAARKILAADPTNEPAHRAMMRAHEAAGDRPAVLRQYEQCRCALSEYGLEPSAEIRALRDEITGKGTKKLVGLARPSAMFGRNEISSFEQSAEPRERPGWRKYSVAALVLAILALLAFALGFWPCSLRRDCSEPTAFPVIVLSLEFDEADRQTAEVAEQIRTVLEDTLGRISGAAVITRTIATQQLPDPLDDSYFVDAAIKRSGDRLRVYVDLRDGGSRSISDQYKIDIDVKTLEPLVNRLEADLIPALRSRIGADHPQN